jgi:hypothetical protein
MLPHCRGTVPLCHTPLPWHCGTLICAARGQTSSLCLKVTWRLRNKSRLPNLEHLLHETRKICWPMLYGTSSGCQCHTILDKMSNSLKHLDIKHQRIKPRAGQHLKCYFKHNLSHRVFTFLTTKAECQDRPSDSRAGVRGAKCRNVERPSEKRYDFKPAL